MSRLEAAGRTHTGAVRTVNQDTFICQPDTGLLAVIDGMGGEAAGEVAAAIARQVIRDEPELRKAFAQANEAIFQRARDTPDEQGMGCVATAVRLVDGQLHLAHVGDTRAYLVRAAGCEQLTRDHTVIAEQREQHGLSEAEARALPGQHQVTRDLGGQHQRGLGWIDVGRTPMAPGDVVMLCSDGLHDLVSEGELSRLLGSARSDGEPPAALVDRLIALALSRGGHDNITVVVGRLQDDAPLAPSPDRPRALLVAAGALALTGLAFAAGRGSIPPPPPPVLTVGTGLAASAGHAQVLLPGPAGLSGELGSGELAAIGVLHAEAAPQTIIQPGASVTLRGALLDFPADSLWRIALQDGAALTLQQAVIRSPSLTLEIEMSPGSTLHIIDSHIDCAALAVRGAADASVRIVGSTVQLEDGEPAVDGPAWEAQ